MDGFCENFIYLFIRSVKTKINWGEYVCRMEDPLCIYYGINEEQK